MTGVPQVNGFIKENNNDVITTYFKILHRTRGPIKLSVTLLRMLVVKESARLIGLQ